MKPRLLLSLLLLLLGSISSYSQPRSESEAREVAQKFLRGAMNARSGGGVSSKPTTLRLVSTAAVNQLLQRPSAAVTRSVGTCTPFYIFNDEADRQFVIVSGDERQEDILGQSDGDTFTVDDVPCGLLTMLGQYAEEFDYLQQSGVQARQTAPVRKAYKDCPPLIKTNWNQSPVYNDQCPMARGERCITGCVATSMAQMINYHQYPERGDGVVQLMPGKNNLPSDKMDLAEKSFNLQVLRDAVKVTSSSPAAQKTAVAYLMKACGYAIGMNYDPDGSSASTAKIPDVFARYFDYEPVAIYASKEMNEAIWEDFLQEDLSDGYPIFYRGQSDASGGHSFLLDGYQASTGMYHFNWGWGGSRDGFYKLSSLTPGMYDFTDKQSVVARVRPKTVEEPIEKPVIVLDEDYRTATVTCATDGVTLYYSFTLQDDTVEADYQRYTASTKIMKIANGTIRAYAERKGKRVEADPVATSWYKVDKPEFYPDGNRLTIKSPRENNIYAASDFYYTTDGTVPTKKSKHYTGPIILTNGTTVKVIGVRKHFATSEIATYSYTTGSRTVYNFTNTAGQIASQISAADKLKVISLTVAGQLNGTDIKFIRDMLTKGELSRLDMKNATIVSGGDAYFGKTSMTEDKVVGNYMFYEAANLTSAILPMNTTAIGTYAFENCTSLTDIEIPEGCTTIGRQAFAQSAITSLHIPKSVTSIGRSITALCKSLTSITVDADNKVYDSRNNCNAIIETAQEILVSGCRQTVIPSTVKEIDMYGFCSSPSKLVIPGNVKTLSVWAFAENDELEEVVLERGVEDIYANCFEKCKNLTSVTIPATCIMISDEAFKECTSLKSVTVNSRRPMLIVDNPFIDSSYKTATLYVPYGSKEAYQKADVWRDFGHIEEMNIEVNGLAELKALNGGVRATLNLEDAQVLYSLNDEGQSDYVFLRDATACSYVWGKGLVAGLGIKDGDYISGSLPVIVTEDGAEVQTSRIDGHNLTAVRNGVAQVRRANPNTLGAADDCDLVEVDNVAMDIGEDFMSIEAGSRSIMVIVLTGESPERYQSLLQPVLSMTSGTSLYNVSGIYLDPDILVLTVPVEKSTADDIEPITAQPADSDAWKTGQFGAYAIRNLSGQRLLKPRKGLNIIGRRKVVVK